MQIGDESYQHADTEVTPSPVLHRSGRVALCILVGLVLWYATIVLFIPEIGNGSPALPAVAHSALVVHANDVCEGRAAFGDVAKSLAVHHLDQTKHHRNQYFVRVVSEDGEAPIAVIAYPQHYRIFQEGLCYRILFLDSRKLTFSTYALRSDGSIWRNTQSRFDEAHQPTPEILNQLGQVEGWAKERTLPLSPPCR